MPDLFHYFFTGIKVNEFTDASTSQMLDPRTRTWAYDLVQAFGLPDADPRHDRAAGHGARPAAAARRDATPA